MSRNVSIRLDDAILKELKELNLSLSDTVRRALLEEIRKKRRDELKKNLDMARELNFTGRKWQKLKRHVHYSVRIVSISTTATHNACENDLHILRRYCRYFV